MKDSMPIVWTLTLAGVAIMSLALIHAPSPPTLNPWVVTTALACFLVALLFMIWDSP